MVRYKCSRCGGDQYSADPHKANEPCIYCGHKKTELMDNIEEPKRKKGANEWDKISTGRFRYC